MFATPSPFLDAEYAYHRERNTADFRSAALRREVRARRRARKVAAARRLAASRAGTDVR